MQPRRQVRRGDVRPSYTRRPNQRSASTPRTPRFQLPVVKISWLRWAIVLTVVLLVLTAFGQLTRYKSSKIAGNVQIESSHLANLTAEGLSKQWLGRNTLLINTGALESYLTTAEPGIKTVQVRRSGLQGLTVTVTERQPSLNWKTGGAVYLLDSDGTIIGPTRGAYAKLPTVVDNSNLPVKAGDRVVPSGFISFVTQFLAGASAAGVQATELYVVESTSEVVVKTAQGYAIKLDTTRPSAEEVVALKQVLAELKRSKKVPKEYIDLRIEKRAYYL